jgi:hypothetical protein
MKELFEKLLPSEKDITYNKKFASKSVRLLFLLLKTIIEEKNAVLAENMTQNFI